MRTLKNGLLISLVTSILATLFGLFVVKNPLIVKDLIFIFAFILFLIASVQGSKHSKELFMKERKFLNEVKHNVNIMNKVVAVRSIAMGGIFNILIYFILFFFNL